MNPFLPQIPIGALRGERSKPVHLVHWVHAINIQRTNIGLLETVDQQRAQFHQTVDDFEDATSLLATRERERRLALWAEKREARKRDREQFNDPDATLRNTCAVCGLPADGPPVPRRCPPSTHGKKRLL